MAVALSTLIFSPLSASPGSDAAVSERGTIGRASEPVSLREQVVDNRTPRSETCRSARVGTAWYRQRQRDWNVLRGVHSRPGRKPHGCADARYLASVAKERASIARRAYGRWLERRTWDVSLAINSVFGSYAGQAHRVVSCESGHSTLAVNGQYLGLFQMGSWERATFGHGPSPLEQARAAHRYFVASGRDWSPWSCKP